MGAFEQLFGLVRGGGNLNNNFPKIQMPGGLPGERMSKLRFDWYIIYKNVNIILDISRLNYPLQPMSVFLSLLPVHVTIILTNLTVLTDHKVLSTVHIPPLLLPLITIINKSINHITITVNHPTPTRNQTVTYQPVINAPDHSTTPIRNLIRLETRQP